MNGWVISGGHKGNRESQVKAKGKLKNGFHDVRESLCFRHEDTTALLSMKQSNLVFATEVPRLSKVNSDALASLTAMERLRVLSSQ